MKIAIGSDQVGYKYKYNIICELLKRGHEVADIGPHSEHPVNSADIVARAIQTLKTKEFNRVILIDATGQEMAIVANKIANASVAICNDVDSTSTSIVKYNCNVMCLGAQIINILAAEKLVELWLSLEYKYQES